MASRLKSNPWGSRSTPDSGTIRSSSSSSSKERQSGQGAGRGRGGGHTARGRGSNAATGRGRGKARRAAGRGDEDDKDKKRKERENEEENVAPTYTPSAAWGLSDSSDEEDEDGEDTEAAALQDAAVKQMLGQYATLLVAEGRDGEEGREELLEAQGRLEDALGDARCLVCLNKVRRTDAVWQCGGCAVLLHLACAQRWAGREKGDHVAAHFPGSEYHKISFYCPKCRKPHTQEQYPAHYYCFCGQTRDPAVDPWLPPHTCGAPCRKPLPTCQHTCALQCHPGATPTPAEL